MAQLPIYNCYHPLLKQKTDKVQEINDEIRELSIDMFETMYKANGIGLAANQVGKEISILVIDVNADKENKLKIPPVVMINPQIVSFSDDEIQYQEGCLSVPKFYEDVVRPEAIEVVYYDIDMKECKIEANEIFARVIQHEVDHLNGILFYERLNPLRRALSKNKLRRVQKGLVVPDYPMIDKDGNHVNF